MQPLGLPVRQAYGQLHQQRTRSFTPKSSEPPHNALVKASREQALTSTTSTLLNMGFVCLPPEESQETAPTRLQDEVASLRSLLQSALRQRRALAAQLALVTGGTAAADALTATQTQLEAAHEARRLLKRERDRAKSARDKAEAGLRQLRSSVEPLYLSAVELEEAMLRNLWLARYWTLAARYGLFPALAKRQSEMWETVTPPGNKLAVLQQAVQRLWSRLQGSTPASDPPSSSDTSRKAAALPDDNASTDEASEPAQSYQATVADALEAERAVQDAHALRLPQAILVAMVDDSKDGRAGSPTPAAPAEVAKFSSEDDQRGLPATSSSSGDLEDEAAFQALWLAFFWCRAALAGVESHIAGHKAAYWHHRTKQPPSSLDLPSLAAALRELHSLGIERQLWLSRQGT